MLSIWQDLRHMMRKRVGQRLVLGTISARALAAMGLLSLVLASWYVSKLHQADEQRQPREGRLAIIGAMRSALDPVDIGSEVVAGTTVMNVGQGTLTLFDFRLSCTCQKFMVELGGRRSSLGRDSHVSLAPKEQATLLHTILVQRHP